MFENVTLEVSLKPFKKTDDAYIRTICRQIFEDWRPLLKGRKTVSVMLWTSDGSEILDYASDMNAPFEWCRFFGTANRQALGEDEPRETSLHSKRQDYMENAPVMTYAILKTIVSTLKEEGERAFPEAIIRVGETFDIGPEFAISDFKYRRHKEICTNTSGVDKIGFVDATAHLAGDNRAYAAYPSGIPDGTPFGTFLGKQSEIFLRDMGFDFLWLSNGVGFSADPWKRTGKIFDGERYYPEKLDETREKVFAFWKLFRAECSFPLETRGTNNSVGIDYATDGVPLYDIYTADLDITAPPNSPWAALNHNYGLEMMGHMTRICELPSERFPFRYYIHDPWWINSPWYDRYDSSPCDIYLPMAISRLTKDGKVESANALNLLSIDNSYGTMPSACINEPLPHLLRAEKNCADAPAPLVWVYPMREYTTTREPMLIREMNLGDTYIMNAINDGFPLNCVVSTDNFLAHTPALYQRSILLSPIPEEAPVLRQLLSMAVAGIDILIYGTEERLAALGEIQGQERIHLFDTEADVSHLREALAPLGYTVRYTKKTTTKPPTLALSRCDNAVFFSVYNENTTTDTHFRFPLGAPLLCGTETELRAGESIYRFSRGEQRECRAFIEQGDGVVSCCEAAPVNARYRRKIKIEGLEDATLYLFPEKGCEASISMTKGNDDTPCPIPFTVHEDEKHGYYLKAEHVTGKVYFLIGHKNTK